LKDRVKTDPQTTPVSAVVINFNGMDCIAATLDSLLASTYPFAEIIVVDDGSRDGSCELIRASYPQVKLVALPQNTGNLALVRNSGIKIAKTRHVFLTDNDIVLGKGCIEQLLATSISEGNVASVTPRLFDQDAMDVVYQSGNGLHFLGVSSGSMRGVPRAEQTDLRPRQSFGGGIMLIDMDIVSKLGYFDQGFVRGWADDGEIHYRAALAGYKSLHDPVAEAYVKVRSHGTNRAFGQYHNRLRLMLTCFSLPTLLALPPALVLFELALFASTVIAKTTDVYWKGWSLLWKSRAELKQMRRRVQAMRRVPDTRLLAHGRFEIPGDWKLSRAKRRVVSSLQRCWDIFFWFAYPCMRMRH
jgi:GT2 family glycosyltransferase